MQNYIVTIKTTRGESIEVPVTASSEKHAKSQVAIFFDANYLAPDRQSYVVKDVTVAD